MRHFLFILPILCALNQEQLSRFPPVGTEGHFIGKNTPPCQVNWLGSQGLAGTNLRASARDAATCPSLPKRAAFVQDQFTTVGQIGGQGIKPQ